MKSIIINETQLPILGFMLGSLSYHFKKQSDDAFPVLISVFDEIEEKGNLKVNRAETMKWLREHGGYNDIEVLLNVLPKFQDKIINR